MPSPRWSLAVLVLLCGHVAWGIGRAAFRTAPRRLEDVATYRRTGDAAFLFADAKFADAERSAAAIAWLRAHTPPDARIAWQGADRGAIEFAAALLWPRLLMRGGTAGPLLEATPTSLTVHER